jgi:hypothetical protein
MSTPTNKVPNTAGVEQAPRIDYAMDANGNITRTDKDSSTIVARYEKATKTVRVIQEWAKFRPAVIRWLNQEEIPIDAILLEGDKPDVVPAGVDIPPRPKMTPQEGDKTPAVVEWYRKYKPNEFKARYGIRREGTVTKYRVEFNERGEKVRVPYQIEATLADRKIHLTEKIVAGDAEDEG